jgi:DNA-binding transcriptional MerR regulator
VLIRELSRKTEVSVRSLRYYETKKLLVSKRLENGYRDYDDTAIERVKTIQLYLGLGLNTDDMAQIIKCPTTQNDRPLCKAAYELYKAKLNEVNKQLDILRNVQLRLQERISELDKLS